MATLGEMLRDAREAKGISLIEAERQTKIRQKYISAIEDDNLTSLPSPVYARGFLRNYAAYLDIDPDEAVETFDEQSQPTRHKIRAARGQAPKPRDITRAEKINIQPLSPERIDTRVRYGVSYITVSLLALPLIIAFYFIYNAYAGNSREVPLPEFTPRPATVTPLATQPAVVGDLGVGGVVTTTSPAPAVPPNPEGVVVTPTIDPAAQPPPPPPPSDKVVVQIVTARDAWMRVIVDGVQKYSGTLPKGTNRSWEGKDVVRIRTGRADSVTVNVNGVDKGIMGQGPNLIAEKEWDRSGNEKVIK